ncbi:hypothetical protein Taro_035623, partial [Colocasia esculenta]|nr:hypothetical protein [Colocasia esculenta]
MDAASGLELSQCGRPPAVAFDFLAGDSSSPSEPPPSKMPRRLRRRLAEGKGGRASVEEIEVKLREADMRRQLFHEWISNKARTKSGSPSWSSRDGDLGQRLEAKLCAAQQKRLSLLQRTQMRLARVDELRQVAKTGVKMRAEKEREELGVKVESRIQHAEANRMLILQACMQRRAIVNERKAQSLLKRVNQENKYKDLVRKAIYQKRAAAEKKRYGLLEAEKTRAHARVMQARLVAKSIFHQREIERRRMKEELEDRLQQAKRKREEYLSQRGSPSCTSRVTLKHMHKHGDEELVKFMSFEQLAHHIESSVTIETVRALLDRLESRLLCLLHSPSGPQNIDHLLKHAASPKRKTLTDKGRRVRGQTKGFNKEALNHKSLSRYPVRVVLCAYVILVHPDSVFSGCGEHEISLADSAASFIREFELLINIILNGPKNISSTMQSLASMSTQQTFRSLLVAFDAAWCTYLRHFVAWKIKDSRLLEEDLVRAAHQLKLTIEGGIPDLSHGVRAIQNQVTEENQLLWDKVQNQNVSAGIGRVESTLSTQYKYFEAKESGSASTTPAANTSSLALMSTYESEASAVSLTSIRKEFPVEPDEESTSVVCSLFRLETSSPPNIPSKNALALPIGKHFMENEILVNEIVHQNRSFIDNFGIDVKEETNIKAKIGETMERAFWDVVVENLMKEQPDYSRMIGVVKEIRDELCAMAPKSWKEEIFDSIDLDILSQVLESRTNDVNYLGKILDYALGTLLKLSAPANEEEIKRTHEKLLIELADVAAQTNKKLNSSFVIVVARGMRFVLEQIQV